MSKPTLDDDKAGSQGRFLSLSPPTYRGSTILYPDYESFVNRSSLGRKAYTYGLNGTPTTRELASKLTEFEGGTDTFLTPSGLMAITTTILAVVCHGDHILLPDSVYAPVRRFAKTTLGKMGVTVEYYDPLKPEKLNFTTPNLRLIWIESPGSITMEVQDIPALSKAAHQHDILVGCDNSWASPIYCKPLNLGADIVVEAVTKYLSGHSDLLLGSITVQSEALATKIHETIISLGIGVSPDDCFLALRGLESATVRLAHIEKSALILATCLKASSTVSAILHPALEDFPTHHLWQQQFCGSSGVFSFVINDETDNDHAARFERLDTFQIGASWGGTHSLIAPSPVSDQVRTINPEFVGKRLVRLSIGLENIDALVKDITAFIS